MSFKSAEDYLTERNFQNRIMTFTTSSATVDLAAKAVGTEPARIAKSLTFKVSGEAVMIICAGDAKVGNSKFKTFFHEKATMLSREEAGTLIGHEPGGICPFGINPGVKVFLDISLKRFDIIYPACGDDASAVKLTPEELYNLCPGSNWIDVCVIPEN